MSVCRFAPISCPVRYNDFRPVPFRSLKGYPVKPFPVALRDGIRSFHAASGTPVGPARHSESELVYEVYFVNGVNVVTSAEIQRYRRLVPNGVYEHDDSRPGNPKLYRVRGCAYLPTEKEFCVLYTPLYPHSGNADALRPYHGPGGWLELRDNGRVRFTRISD